MAQRPHDTKAPNRPSRIGSQFSPYHHEKTRFAYQHAMKLWSEKVSKGTRCEACWLRKHDCYCSSYLIHRRKVYREMGYDSNEQVEFLLYYHFREIGRT